MYLSLVFIIGYKVFCEKYFIEKCVCYDCVYFEEKESYHKQLEEYPSGYYMCIHNITKREL